MVTLTETITVRADLATAFQYVADFSNLPDWDPGIERARKITAGRVGRGTSFEVIARFAGRDIPMRYKVDEWQPPYQVVLEGWSRTIHAVDTIRFQPVAGGVRIEYVAELTFAGLLSFLEPLLRGRLVAMGQQALAGLKRRLDGITEEASDDTPSLFAPRPLAAEAA